MESVIYFFNTITNFLKEIIDGIIQFFNTIPDLFNNIGNWANQLFPADFASYIVAFVPIIITLVIIKFIRG